MKPKYQIFISSTSQDLKDERRSLIERIWSMGHIPVGTELFQASNRKHWDYISRRICECDFLILLVAERYGAVDKSGKSYTQREYEFAIESGVPTIAFLLDSAARQNWPVGKVEHNRTKEIEGLRELCSGDEGRLCKSWSDMGSLSLGVSDSLIELFEKTERPGLVRPDSALMDRLGLDENMPHSKKVSDVLSNAVKRDLELSGYFREDQLLHFQVSNEERGLIVKLHFTASIVPLNGKARVYRPIVEEASKQVLKTKDEYRVNDTPVTGPYRDIDHVSKDELVVHYQLLDQSIEQFVDDHFWPSPVLGYTVRFDKSDLFHMEVGKIIGRDTDSLEPVRLGSDLYTDFISKAAAFSAQGLRWKLKRLPTVDLANHRLVDA
jgi:hypothetical protein